MKPLHKYKTKQEREQALKENRALLEGFFGKAINYDNPKPLKIGFFEEMCARAQELGLPFSKTFFRQSIRDYTRRAKYHYAIAAGGSRYDLQGNESGIVSEDEKKSALEALERIKAAAKRRYKDEREQGRKPKASKRMKKPKDQTDPKEHN